MVTIVSHEGRVVYQKKFTEENLYTEIIDISNEPPGVYALIVQTGDEMRYQTFSKG